MLYILNIEKIKKMTVKDLRLLTFENYYKRIDFTKKGSYYSLKKYLILFAINLTKKIPDPTKCKEHHELFLKNNRKRIQKTSKNSDIKSAAVKHSKTAFNLLKPIEQ